MTGPGSALADAVGERLWISFGFYLQYSEPSSIGAVAGDSPVPENAIL